MAKISSLTPDGDKPKLSRKRSEIRFPTYGVADSIAVAKAIHERGGGKANADQLAAYLGYKGTTNGAYLARVGAARLFGIIAKSGHFFVVTPLGQQILMPTYPDQGKQGVMTAFLNVEGYRRVIEEFKGKALPPDFGMKNALRNTFGVVPSRIDVVYRVLMDSADDAGFFATRGARTHLVMPTFQPPSGTATGADGGDTGSSSGTGGGTGGGNGGDSSNGNTGNSQQLSLQGVKARYLQTLINMLEEKSKNGEPDEALMTRIEKLLGEQT